MVAFLEFTFWLLTEGLWFFFEVKSASGGPKAPNAERRDDEPRPSPPAA
jgi:hypothetical protein